MTRVGVIRMGSRYCTVWASLGQSGQCCLAKGWFADDGYHSGMGVGWLCETHVPVQYPCGNLFT